MDMKRIHLAKIDSTNSYLSRLVREKGPCLPIMLTTDYQSGGRGRSSNAWESEPGKNLIMSVLLFPAFLSASDQFSLSRMVSLSICELLDGLGVSPRIKWPNDILTGRGKIAGILIENAVVGTSVSHTILGMGINLNQSRFTEYPLPATSVVLESGQLVDRAGAERKLGEILMRNYTLLEKGRGFEREYLDGLYGLDRPMWFESKGRTFKGIIRGTEQGGELQVETEEGMEAFLFGDIAHIMDGFLPDRGN